MEILHQRCSGIDVHKKSVVACVLTSEGRETRTFGTMTADLLALADWLAQRGVTHVAMESTGVYWKPVYNILEGGFEVLLANAQHIKALPGRKTDVQDAEWIADLLRHGLVRASFIPPRTQRELRELVRHRRSLIRQRAEVVNRIQKVLEGGNVKLSSVATDVVGVSGRAMLKAMVAGVEDPKALVALAKGRLRNKERELEVALQGLVGPHQRLLLGSHLRQLDFLDEEIGRMEEEINVQMAPFESAIQVLDEVHGLGRRTSQEVLAEIGMDMSRFATAAHISSWAKLCPGNNMSAGKRKSGRTGHGNPWLRSALVEAAWAASRTRNTYLSAQYHRLAARCGATRAIVAVAHTILVTIYHLLRRGTSYQDLGGNFFDERDRQAAVRRSVRRIERLGYKVILEAA